MERRELTGAHNKAEKLQTWTSPRGTHPWPPKQTLSLEASESSYAWSYKPHQLSSWVSFWLMTFFFFFWLPWVFVLVCRLFLLAVCRLLLSWSPGSRACGLSSCSIWASCPEACGILVPQPELEPMSLALDGGFLLDHQGSPS